MLFEKSSETIYFFLSSNAELDLFDLLGLFPQTKLDGIITYILCGYNGTNPRATQTIYGCLFFPFSQGNFTLTFYCHMVVVAVGLEWTLGFFPTMTLAWMAWLQSCGVNTAGSSAADVAQARALRVKHWSAIVAWASQGLALMCFRPEVDKLLLALGKLKEQGKVAHVVLFTSMSNLFGWVDVVKAVLDRYAPDIIDRVVAREEIHMHMHRHRPGKGHLAPPATKPTAAILWHLGVPVTTPVFVLESKEDSVACSTEFAKVIHVRLSHGPRMDHVAEDLQDALNSLQRETGSPFTAAKGLAVMIEDAKAKLDTEIMRCVSPPLDFMDRPDNGQEMATALAAALL